MATRGIHDTIKVSRALQQQLLTNTGSPDMLDTGDVDLQGFDSAMFMVDFGDIDEIGGSPVGGAQVEVRLQHADDDGAGAADTYENVASDDVDGPGTITNGIVATVATDAALVAFGYVGPRRFVRVQLLPTGLTNGGNAGVWLIQEHAHITPVAQG